MKTKITSSKNANRFAWRQLPRWTRSGWQAFAPGKIAVAAAIILASGNAAQAQITLLQDYQNNTSATIGTFQGISFREAGFSGLCPIANTNGKEFWTVSDRGVNVDAANANLDGCRPTYDKIYAFPAYVPKIHRIRINGDTIRILRTITMKRPTGTGASGIINPAGFGSTATELASTDTVKDCGVANARFLAKTVAKDVWGIDSEGIVVDADGNFWICEEGGPTIWKLNPNGVVIRRYTPFPNQAIDVLIDPIFAKRKNNRGFEGITITPNGKIYAFIQSPLLNPTQSAGESTRIHRILEISPIDNSYRMFAYLNPGPVGVSGSNQLRFRDWKIGDMAAINNTQFLVLEAAIRGTSDSRKVYKIDISGATPITSGATLYGGLTLEQLVDDAGLATGGVTPVSKTLFMDLLANGWPVALDKPEGFAIINASTIAIGNDNDFGQRSLPEDGVAEATTNKSHVFTYNLAGADMLAGYQQVAPVLNQGVTSNTSSQAPYLLPTKPGANFAAIMTANDVTTGGYRMAGTPDGLGAFDNGNNTFTVLMNHEFGNTAGVVRAHGSKGAFVSKWIVNKSDLSVISGSDLIQSVYTWNTGTNSYNAPGTLAFNRFCSADLPEVSAFYNAGTGKGTQERIFMNGEENGNEGRGFGHIVTGADAGKTYELPFLGKFSWENAVASPFASDNTVVAGLDDSTPGQVYFYVGTKTTTGTDIAKAGLSNGKLYGVKVVGLLTETNATNLAQGTRFSLADLGFVQNKSGGTLQAESNNAGVTSFLRPEDGAFDPSNPRDFYFATTNGFGSPSRLWRLRFDDAANYTAGGTIEAVLNGTEGQQMLDNIGIDKFGHINMVEDVGGNAHLGKVWQYNIATDELIQVGQPDPTRFLNGSANFLTQDEEASGPIDATDILGAGWWLIDIQAHYGIAGEVVEGGQLMAFYNPASISSCEAPATRLYVDKNNPAPGNGSSWTCALAELKTAVNMANATPAIKEIWVADGVYKPTTGNDRTAVLAITRADLKILGGFAGGETNEGDADPSLNLTIISGDLGTVGVSTDNSYRLVNIGGSPVNTNALIIDGFIFENGNANGTGDRAVGAAILSNAIPAATPVQLKRNTFRNNNASSNGGAVYLTSSSPVFDGCKFAANTAGAAGGAVFSFQASPIFSNTLFSANSAVNGGAYYGNYGYPKFRKTVFAGNNATYGGAALQNFTDADYINCVFNANTSYQGGAIYEQSGSFSHIVNTTFFKNSGVSYGGTIVLTGGNSRTTTENSIFYKNTHGGSATSPWADFVNYTGGSNIYANNILQQNTAVPADNGTNIRNNTRGTDPVFVNEASVLGGDGVWATADDGLGLTNTSPAKDAGDNALAPAGTDITNSSRVVCSVVDKGAYESQAPCGPIAQEEGFVKGAEAGNGTGAVVNPFSNDLQFRYMGIEKAAISVTSASGKMMSIIGSIKQGITHIDASTWSSGLYEVVITTASGKRSNFKVVKM
ncbi:MAG: esterase-like activity of phytase family protein [Bacteroidota bacterium]